MNAWRSRWRGRLRKPGLRGRTALAMVVTVALACAVLTITTTLWAATNHRENQEQRLKDAISGDADRLRAALEINPNATTDTELWEQAGTRPSAATTAKGSSSHWTAKATRQTPRSRLPPAWGALKNGSIRHTPSAFTPNGGQAIKAPTPPHGGSDRAATT